MKGTEVAERITESDEFHVFMTAFPGKTAQHLRDVHGIEPADDKRTNARLHLEAHGYPEDVKPTVRMGRAMRSQF